MNVLRSHEEQVMCPYNAAHYIRKARLDVHLTKCRKSHKSSEVIVICDFNAAHRIPQPELQYHHDICPDRKSVELHVFHEESLAPPPPTFLPPVPVPVDSTWDDEDVPSYNPTLYCEQNNILRRLDTASAAVRRDFRIAERHRIENLRSVETSSDGANSSEEQGKEGTRKKKTENSQNLPPIPALSQGSVESTPEEVTRIMKKMSIIPKAAVIPKQK